MRPAYGLGPHINGARKPTLTPEQDEAIRRDRDAGVHYSELVKKYGVSKQTITAAARRADAASTSLASFARRDGE